MPLRQINRLLKIGAVLFLAAAAAIIAGEFNTPRGLASLDPPSRRAKSAVTNRFVKAPPLEEFALYWDRRLQGTGFDPLPEPMDLDPEPEMVADEPPLRATDRLRVRLVGTILEAGRSRAIFLGPQGRIDQKGVGQKLDLSPAGILVEQIQLASVTLSYQGEKVTLRLASPEGRP